MEGFCDHRFVSYVLQANVGSGIVPKYRWLSRIVSSSARNLAFVSVSGWRALPRRLSQTWPPAAHTWLQFWPWAPKYHSSPVGGGAGGEGGGEGEGGGGEGEGGGGEGGSGEGEGVGRGRGRPGGG